MDVADALHAIGMNFDPVVQNQRGALALIGDGLYLPYGAHFGGCGDFYGWVVGLRVDQPAAFAAWRTSARGGGIWAPGGIAYDGHDLFAITGFMYGATDWLGSEAVIRPQPDLGWQPTPRDFFAPSDWSQAQNLGGANPLPLDLPGGGVGATLLIALGGGTEYLLDRAELGGIGHPLAQQEQVGGGMIASPAAYRLGRDMLVAFRADGPICRGKATEDGLMALRISAGPPATMHAEWCAGLSGQGAPIVTTNDDAADPIVWIVGAEGDERLHGFRGDNGQEIFTSEPMSGLRHFVTVLAAAGRLYVAADRRVFAFGLAH